MLLQDWLQAKNVLINKHGIPELQIINSFSNPGNAQLLYKERWQIGVEFYGKKNIMQSDIIKYAHNQFINPFTLQYHFA